MNNKLIKFIKSFPSMHILVIGDVMLDCFTEGVIERISPEAPVPIVLVKKEVLMPGGAANVANNLVSLGVKVNLIGLIGQDTSAQKLLDILKEKRIDTQFLIRDQNYPTILKTRVTVQGRHILRIDRENKDYINKSIERGVSKSIQQLKNKIDAVVVSDYSKGCLTANLVDIIFKTFSSIPIAVDTKPEHINWFRNAALIAPNLEEATQMVRTFSNEQGINKIGQLLSDKFNTNILITLGANGMTLFAKNKKPFHLSACAKNVRDVSGAGDTVIALVAASITSGANSKQATIIANQAAGITVGKLGIAVIKPKELINNLKLINE